MVLIKANDTNNLGKLLPWYVSLSSLDLPVFASEEEARTAGLDSDYLFRLPDGRNWRVRPTEDEACVATFANTEALTANSRR